MGYSYDTIFTPEEIADLNQIYEVSDNERVKRYYNLFYVNMRHNNEKLNSYGQALAEKFGFTEHRCYFLEYTKDSFARMHNDADELSAKTVITLIHASDDLVGGDTIIMMPHFKKNDFEYDLNRYRVVKEEDHCQGAEIIPVVIKMEVGQSVIYDQNLQHAVAQVEQGVRRVLVTWLK